MLTFRESDHTYWHGDILVPGVTTILKPLTDLDGIPPHILRRAADRGTAVHYGCELYDEDNLDWDSLDAELVPYIEAWAEFRAITGFKPERIEEMVFHPGLFYAGKLDRTGVIEGERAVVDIKTSKTMYPTVGMQLAAYAEALHAEHPEEPKHTARYGVQLKEDGKWQLHPYKDKADWPTFVALKTLVGWADRNKQRINYEPK